MGSLGKVYSFGGRSKEAILFYESIFGKITINKFLKFRDDKSLSETFREDYKDLYKYVDCEFCGNEVTFTDINFSDDGDIETFMYASNNTQQLNDIMKKLDCNNYGFEFTEDVEDFFIMDKFNKCWWIRRMV